MHRNCAEKNTVDFVSRTELGEDIEIVMLEMSAEEQEDRIRARHGGSQDAVDMFRVG